MTNSASADDLESDDFLKSKVDPRTRDRSSDPTRDYSPDDQPKAEGELILTGIVVQSSEFKIPAKLGKYAIQEEVGRGGMGVVLKGFDPDLQRTVAIKVLTPHLAMSAVARRRFQREARAAAAINHENVLTIHSVEEQNETPFLVMEFVSGQSLKEYLAQRKRLDALEVIRLSTQIAQGLAAAHLQGVIHRDVKPANVMLHEGATRVRLMDFGLARIAFDNSDLTSHDHTVGTPAYMAPEQIRGHEVDARADLFSFGCVLYFMVAGYSPFHGKSQAETIHRILDTEPPPLCKAIPGTPPILSEIIHKLLAKNPDERFQSSQEVADLLRNLQTTLNQTPTDQMVEVLSKRRELSEPVSAGVDSAQTASPSGSHRLRAVGATILIGVAAAIMGSVWFAGPLSTWLTPRGAISLVGTNRPETNSSQTSLVDSSPHVELPKLERITVGPGPDATFKTIAEAIERVATNGEITVVGPGPYEESLSIQGPSHHGLRLIASPRVTLRPAIGDGSESRAFEIRDVTAVSVTGFDVEIQSEKGRALQTLGTVNDVSFVDCTFKHLLPEHRRSLVNIGSLSDNPNSPIRFMQCHLSAAKGSVMCLAIEGEDSLCSSVECVGCVFSGPNTMVLVKPACRRLKFAGNVFLGGQNAVNVDLQKWHPDSRIDIVNNTFVESRYWLGLMNSFRREGQSLIDITASDICNNLILGGERVQGGDDQWKHATSHWRFLNNHWETGSSVRPTTAWKEGDWNGRVAELHAERFDIPVRDDPLDPAFLVPAKDSPLLTSGAGNGIPLYVGAKEPMPNP